MGREQALMAKQLHGFANRCTTHAELLSQGPIVHIAAGRHEVREYPLAQLVGNGDA